MWGYMGTLRYTVTVPLNANTQHDVGHTNMPREGPSAFTALVAFTMPRCYMNQKP
jgi:hypothetical protein